MPHTKGGSPAPWVLARALGPSRIASPIRPSAVAACVPLEPSLFEGSCAVEAASVAAQDWLRLAPADGRRPGRPTCTWGLEAPRPKAAMSRARCTSRRGAVAVIRGVRLRPRDRAHRPPAGMAPPPGAANDRPWLTGTSSISPPPPEYASLPQPIPTWWSPATGIASVPRSWATVTQCAIRALQSSQCGLPARQTECWRVNVDKPVITRGETVARFALHALSFCIVNPIRWSLGRHPHLRQ